MHPFDDSDVTWERLDEWYTANLVNGLGNLVARVMKMAETHLVEKAPLEVLVESLSVDVNFSDIEIKYTRPMNSYDLQSAMDYIWSRIQKVDEEIAITEPFKLIKIEPEKAKSIIQDIKREINSIAYLLVPFMPDTADLMLEAVAANKKPENLFKRLES